MTGPVIVPADLADDIASGLGQAVSDGWADVGRIRRSPASDGYTEEDIEYGSDWARKCESTVERFAALRADPEMWAIVTEAIGDAYAYRLGEADPNVPDELDPADREPMERYEKFAARFGFEIE